MYDPEMVQPMREELTRLGVTELLTAEEVDVDLKDQRGTTLVIVNSVCGCAAGCARPGVALALRHKTQPNKVVTVFAGQDAEATVQARSYFTGYAPSSPQMALMRDGQVVFMLERHQIEGQTPEGVAASLTQAFDQFCGDETPEPVAAPVPAAAPAQAEATQAEPAFSSTLPLYKKTPEAAELAEAEAGPVIADANGTSAKWWQFWK